ncbi:hypothetical protein ABIB42_001177 [Massilia sp. UYP32]|uniref:hypothetical protein n=1 Tax=Massilia TaxID=149698 RepID=UPI00267DA1F9|nr:hypothetical protein [Massilia timonae]
MDIDWAFLPSLVTGSVSAIAGLIGVWLGGYLTTRREDRREEKRVSKESAYLGILVTSHLEKLADECYQVAFDNGEIYGRPAGNEGQYWATVTTLPNFAPLELDVDWKSLPADLMHRILSLPYQIEQLRRHISAVHEMDDFPDFTEYFWVRQIEFAKLGLHVSELAMILRQHASLPASDQRLGGASRDDDLRKQISTISKEKRAYEKRVAEAHSENPPPPVTESA